MRVVRVEFTVGDSSYPLIVLHRRMRLRFRHDDAYNSRLSSRHAQYHNCSKPSRFHPCLPYLPFCTVEPSIHKQFCSLCRHLHSKRAQSSTDEASWTCLAVDVDSMDRLCLVATIRERTPICQQANEANGQTSRLSWSPT